MNTSAYAGLVIVLALICANMPFINDRLLSVIRMPSWDTKPLWMRLVELLIWYFLVGGIGMAIEQYQGQIYPQNWEFYAVTVSMFLTFAFPGFVFRYLVKRR